MKLRIQGNSLRLRLTRSEVTRLREEAQVEDVIDFGSGQNLIYVLQSAETAAPVSATYRNGGILVTVNRQVAQEFADTDRVSIAGEQATDAGDVLEILVEKDFKCMHKDAPDNSDAFPNPLAEASANKE